MKDRDRYLKIVEWSEEDKCYVGRCPGLMMGGVHGIDEQKVFLELCTVIDEWIETIKKDGKPMPKATANKQYSGRFLLRVGNDLHRALAVRALKGDQSLNNYAVQILKHGIMPGGSRRNTPEGANILKKPGSPPSASQVSLLHCRTELSTQWKQADSTARMSNMPRLTARVPVWKFTWVLIAMLQNSRGRWLVLCDMQETEAATIRAGSIQISEVYKIEHLQS